ncbi:MAG: family 10 glycosylhydrolase [Planctomycetia bacterium]|nr:family 10 glycosylhydrolase [Planctomycetia bacterium]
MKRRFIFQLVLLCALFASGSLLADDWGMVRLRVMWGGTDAAAFGEIECTTGTVQNLAFISVDADHPGGAWIVDGKIQIRQHVAKSFHGFDISVPYHSAGRIRFRIASTPQFYDLPWREIPLASILADGKSIALDEEGKTQLSIRRAPGDTLRVAPDRDNLVFAPGEFFRAVVQPAFYLESESASGDIEIIMYRGRESFEIRREKKSGVRLRGTHPVQIELAIPEEEGVYDIEFLLKRNPMEGRMIEPLSRPLTTGPLSGTRLDPTIVAANRRVQIVVISPRDAKRSNPENYSDPARVSELETTLVMEIDPSNPKWSQDKDRSVSRLLRGRGNVDANSLGSESVKVVSSPVGPIMEMASAGAGRVSWEAYPLYVERTGMPHILEVEYPAHQEQTLGVSVVEANPAGAVVPMGLDSGINVPKSALSETPKPFAMEKFRLIIWPKTRNPILILTNRHERQSAFYGKIRVLSAGASLPSLGLPTSAPFEKRLVAGMFAKPIFPEALSSTGVMDSASSLCLDDWITFHEAGERLLEYAKYTGYNGMVLSVYADGSTIYPSRYLSPTARYDTGVYFSNGQDPVRKDVLEMLFRMFDRENEILIPSFDFNAPIGELELASRFPEASELRMKPVAPGFVRWCDYQGRELPSTRGNLRHGTQYYNILHPNVQETILQALAEVVRRYGHHPSFGGISLQLHTRSILTLPPAEWGMDAFSIDQFSRETNFPLPADGMSRLRILSSGEGQTRWLQWRATKLTQFYRRAAALLASYPNARLYLMGTNLFSGTQQPELTPNLSRLATAEEILLRVGLDAAALNQIPNLVFPRPQRATPNSALFSEMPDLQWKQAPGTFRLFQNQRYPSSVVYHPAQELRLEEFDAKSPFNPTYTWLAPTFSQTDEATRRIFAEAVGMEDSALIVMGGITPPFGKEETVRGIVQMLSALPNAKFHSAMMSARGDTRSQPIIFRSYPLNGTNFIYAINMTPFPLEGVVYIQPSVDQVTQKANPFSTTARKLSNGEVFSFAQSQQGTFWRVRLAPYQIESACFSGSPVVLVDPTAFYSPDVKSALARESMALQKTLTSLSQPTFYVGLRNAGFERILETPEISETTEAPSAALPDWEVSYPTSGARNGLMPAERLPGDDGSFAKIDTQIAASGQASLRLYSPQSRVRVMSRPFATSTTGRLSVFVWMRTDDPLRPLPLYFILEGNINGNVFYRTANLSASTQKITAQWTQLAININDLPLDNDLRLSIGFELAGPGNVWIDHIQLSDMSFSTEERTKLDTIFASFDNRLAYGDLAPCVSILESYWMRFLRQNVSTLPPPATNPLLARQQNSPDATPSHSTTRPPQRMGDTTTTTAAPTAPASGSTPAPAAASHSASAQASDFKVVPPKKKKSYLDRLKQWAPW